MKRVQKLSLAAATALGFSIAWFGVANRYTIEGKYHVWQYRHGINREDCALAMRDSFRAGGQVGRDIVDLLHESDPGSPEFSYLLYAIEGNSEYIFDSIAFRIQQAEATSWGYPVSMIGLRFKDEHLTVETDEQRKLLQRFFECSMSSFRIEERMFPGSLLGAFWAAQYLGSGEQQDALACYNSLTAQDYRPWVKEPAVFFLKSEHSQVKAESFAEAYGQLKLAVDDPKRYFEAIR